MALKGCCGCNNLRNGTIGIAITLLVLHCIGAMSTTGKLIRLGNPYVEHVPNEGAYLAVGLTVEIVTILFNVLLILGVQRSSRSMVLAWVIFHGIYFSLLSLGVIALIVVIIIVAQAVTAGWVISLLVVVTVLVALFSAACWYWFAVVLAHLNDMSDENGFGYQKHSTALVERQ